MSAKHTPGPWFVDEPASFMQTRVMARNEHGFPHQVALCEEPRHPVAAANARLIAAAPGLLEALEAVLLFHSGGSWDSAKSARWDELAGANEATTRGLCNRVRAAIAKARGES